MTTFAVEMMAMPHFLSIFCLKKTEKARYLWHNEYFLLLLPRN